MVVAFAAGSARAQTLAARSGDGLFAATVQDTLLDVQNAETGEILDRWQLDRPATALALNDWGGIVYLGYGDGRVIAVDSGEARQRWAMRPVGAAVLRIAQWGGDVLVVGADGDAAILDSLTGRARPDSPPHAPAAAMAPPVAATLFSEIARIGFADGRIDEYDRIAKAWQTVFAPGSLTPDEVRAQVELVPDVTFTVTQAMVSAAPAPMEVCLPPVDGLVECRSVNVPALNRSTTHVVTAADIDEAVDRGRFPWPPPPYSDVHVIEGKRLALSGMRTFEDVSRRVRDALLRGAYTAPRHYGIDDGFVMVTQVEEIDEHGAPVRPSDRRWWNGEGPRPDPFTFSLKAFFAALASAPVGRYRIIAFALNTGECASPPCERTAALDPASARLLADGGEPTLPYGVRNEIVDPLRHHLSVLVYAFEKPNKTRPATLTRRLTAMEHLTAAGIVAGLP